MCMLETTLSRLRLKLRRKNLKSVHKESDSAFLSVSTADHDRCDSLKIENGFEQDQSDLKSRLGGMHDDIN